MAVLPLALSGCAAGVTGLVAAIFASGGGGGGAAPDPIVSSVEPRQSAVVGGVELELKGQNFDKTSQVSFGGIAATSTTFVDRETLRVVVPASFTGLASPAPDDPLKYTDTNPDLRMQVSNKKRFSFAPFWYMRPKIRSVFELVAGVELETYGHRTDRKTVYLRGDFFGFTRDPETEIRLIRLAGDTEIPVAVIRRQGASSDPFFWEISERETCTSLPCLADPHQGREIKITLPIEGDTLAAALVSGPVYILRVVNDSGVDDVDFGYAPPFPPVNFACSAVTLPGDSRAVQLTWDENPLNGLDTFDIVFVDRFDPVESRWVPLATVPGGVGEYLDDTVTTTNYVYRIYGRLGGGDYVGQNSPAVTCEVAVLPLGITDFIIDLSTKLKISPLGTSKISPLGAVRQAPTGAESLQGVIQGLGRQAFLLRGQRSVDQLSDSLSQFYDAGGQNIGITWVTTGDGLRFGVPPVDGLKDVLSYYRGITDDGRAARGLYIEGQHVVAALGAAIDADPVTVGGSGGAGERSELEAMLIEQLGEFDPRRDVETYDTVDGLSVAGVTGIQWSGRGVSAYGQQAQDALGTTGSVLSSATGHRGSGESAVSREVAAGLFVDLGLDGGPSARTILSLLHVDGFSGTDARRRVVQRYIDRLGGARAVVPPRPGGLRIV
ncbi:MAG: IPT/TIG domain-containing protein, partial [Planctomycetes bacterium]|nr:IPT/TIG domain-containing protein [Planctomycetota bacterium]